MNFIIFLICLLKWSSQDAEKNPINLKLQRDRFEFAAPGNIYCFDDSSVNVESINSVTGTTTDKRIIDSMHFKDNQNQKKKCFKIIEYYFYMIIMNNKDEKMLFVNQGLENDYQKDNKHVREMYYKNDFECFHFTPDTYSNVVFTLVRFSTTVYLNWELKMHCIIFYKEEESLSKKVVFINKEVVLNYEETNYDWPSLIKSWDDCTDHIESNRHAYAKINIKPPQRIVCYNPKLHTLEDYRRGISNNYAPVPGQCKKRISNNKYCIRFNNPFSYAILKPIASNQSYLVHDIPTRMEIKDYSINEILCMNEYFIIDKSDLLIGYRKYDSKPTAFCLRIKDIYGKDKIYYNNVKVKIVNVRGCDVDIRTPITYENQIIFDDTKKSFCFPRSTSVIHEVKLKSSYKTNLVPDLTTVCSITFPTKICYSFSQNVVYAILMGNHHSKKTYVLNKNNFINKDLRTDYLYRESYDSNDVVCFHSKYVKDVDKHKTSEYLIELNGQPCFILNKITNNEKLELLNIGGCSSRLIKIIPSSNLQTTATNDEELECDPFYKEITPKEPFLLLDSINKIIECLTNTCTNILEYFELRKSDGAQSILSVTYKSCVSSPSINCVIESQNPNSLIVYKTTHTTLRKTFLVSTNDILPDVISDDYREFYKKKYGVKEIVCFLKNKMNDVRGEDFEIKNDKIVCKIVEKLQSKKEIEIENFMGCKQIVELDPSVSDSSDSRPDLNKQCLPFTTSSRSIIEEVDSDIFPMCLEHVCNDNEYVIESNNDIIGENEKIIDCVKQSPYSKCGTAKGKILFMMFLNTMNSNGKSLMSKDISIVVRKNYYYKPIYSNSDFVCFEKSKVSYDQKWNDFIVDKKEHLCVFPRHLNDDLSINLNYHNKFCTRKIVFKSTSTEPSKEGWESQCNEFVDVNLKNTQTTVKKLQEVKECLSKLCISLEYLVTINHELKNCNDVDCYNFEGTKYIKAKSQYNDNKYYIIRNDVYDSLVKDSSADSYFSSAYFDLDVLCISNDIHTNEINPKSDFRGISLTDEITCYFIKELKNTATVTVNMKKKCQKVITLYTNERTDTRMESIITQETNCKRFYEKENPYNSYSEMMEDELIKCQKLTCFETISVVKKPSQSTDVKTTTITKVSQSKADHADTLKNYEYAQIKSIFFEDDIFIKNSVSRVIVKPERYFYLPSYYSDEVVCIDKDSIQNQDSFNYTNSYLQGNYKCIMVGSAKDVGYLQIKDTEHCSRNITLHSDKKRTDATQQTSNENKCNSFIRNSKNVNTFSAEEIKKCLVLTCSKVLQVVEIPEDVKPMLSGNIIGCRENDYNGQCLKTGKKYDFIEVSNSYVTDSIYFRTEDSASVNSLHSNYVYYEPSYGREKVVCWKKELIKQLGTLQDTSYTFVENTRVCILNNKLSQDLNVKYKINEKCDLNILLKTEPHPSASSSPVSETDICRSFITLVSKPSEILKITKDQLERCREITCSTIKQIILPSSINPNRGLKRVLHCDSTEKSKTCNPQLDESDAIKIVSPFHQQEFYVSIKDTTLFVVPNYKKHYYFDQYFSEEVVCFDSKIITTLTENWNSFDIIQSGSKVCFVVKDIAQNLDIKIKQFDMCEKTITMKYNDLRDTFGQNSECSEFHEIASKSQFTMSLDKLKQCLLKTCSKIHYMVVENIGKETFEKSVLKCTSETGQSTCIDNKENYVFAKVSNPSLDAPVYFKSHSINELEEHSNPLFFYKSEYYNDSAVCLPSSLTRDINLMKVIFFDVGSFKCLINGELSEDIEIIQNLGTCSRTISLKKDSPVKKAVLLQRDIECKVMLDAPSTFSSVNTIELESLKTCLSHTCSVIEGAVEISSAINNGQLAIYAKCPVQQGSSICLDSSNQYDFIKVTNSYVSQPIYFRTGEIPKPSIENSKQAILYNLTYFEDDVVCFDTTHVDAPKNSNEIRGIFIDKSKMCIIIPELSNDVKVTHKIAEGCTAEILLSKSYLELKDYADQELRKRCNIFLSQPNSITHDLLSNDILECVAITCSTITSVSKIDKKDNNQLHQDCKDKQMLKECLENIKDTDTITISSPFLAQSINIRKTDNDELRYSSSQVPRFYQDTYYGDQVLCIRTTHLVEPENIQQLVSSAAAKEIEDKYCILVNKVGQNTSIKVRQFGKCEKSIFLLPKIASPKEIVDIENDGCHYFYQQSNETPKQMTLENLKKCIKDTCSKIKYFVQHVSDLSPMKKTQECDSEEGDDGCLGQVSAILFVKISNEASDKDITVTTVADNNIDALTYDKYYYKQSLLQNDVICIPITKLVNSALYTDKVSFSTVTNKCIISSELATGSTIDIKSSSGCIRKITITSLIQTASELSEDSECVQFTQNQQDSNVVQKIDKETLQKCLTHTCSLIESTVEIPTDQPFMQSKQILCQSNSCLQSDRVYDFIKVKNDYLNQPIFLRTYDPENMKKILPVSLFLYKSIYHKDDVVCLKKEKLPTTTDQAPMQGIFAEKERSCILSSEVTSSYDLDVSLKTNCVHRIKINPVAKPIDFIEETDEKNRNCRIFLTDAANSDSMHIMNKSTLLKCLKYTCSKVESFIDLQSGSESYTSKSLSSCNNDDEKCLESINDFENMKIQSPFLKLPIFLRSSPDNSDISQLSKTTQYLDYYSNDDIFCISEDFINDLNSMNSNIYMFRKNDAYCMVAKNMPTNTNINIKQYGHCNKNIIFNPDSSAANLQDCIDFYTAESTNSEAITHSKLLQCIEKTCSKVDYYVSNNGLNDMRIKRLKSCETGYGDKSCIESPESYQIVKISNPSKSSSFIVKLDSITSSINTKNADSILPKYFYKTDYFENEIVCIETTNIKTTDRIDSINSYTIGDETCIIVKELSTNKVMQFKSGNCDQTINLFPTKSSDSSVQANKLFKQCQLFINPNKNPINYMSHTSLTECMKFTCSELESYHEIDEKSNNYMSGLIQDAKSPQTFDTFDNQKNYDYIKFTSEFVGKPLYFRTTEYPQGLSEDVIKKVYYKDSYQQDDVICFETNQIQEPIDFGDKVGFFVRGIKTCVIAKELASATTIKINITKDCSRSVIISNSNISDRVEEDKSQICSHFITKSPHAQSLPVCDSEKLLTCLKATCSSIISYVPATVEKSTSISKKIISCKPPTSDLTCLGDIKDYEALEIFSPITNYTFYVQSSISSDSDATIFRNSRYSESYYNDEVVCAYKDFVDKRRLDNTKVVYEKTNSYCFIVKESNSGDSFTLKLHGQCDKIINLIPSETSEGKTPSPLVGRCEKFYETSKKPLIMDMDLFKKCIEITCSKINYFVDEFVSQTSAINSLSNCDSPYGLNDCISSLSPYLLKVTNPASSNVIYVRNEKVSEIDSKSLEKIFYKDQYQEDEIVCFNVNMIQDDTNVMSIQTDPLVKCFVGREMMADSTKIELTMIDRCNKDISILKSVRSSTNSLHSSEDCHEFVSTSPKSNNIVNYIDINKLTGCITRTCSKVVTFMKVKTDDDISSSQALEKCQILHGDSSCLSSDQSYDFIKITNSFLPSPLLYRTSLNLKTMTSRRDLPLFYSSAYSGDMLTCFTKTDVLNHEDLNHPWIHKEDNRICVLVSDVSSTTKLKVKVSSSCSREITFYSKYSSDDGKSLKDTDEVCRTFYDPKHGNLVWLTLDQLKTCLTTTCSTIKNEEIRNMLEACSSKQDAECESQIQSLRIDISSPYRTDPVLVISPETHDKVTKLINDPSKYSLIYTKNSFPCVSKESSQHHTDEIRAFTKPDHDLKCYQFESSDSEYVATINMGNPPSVKIYGNREIEEQLQSAYEVRIDIFTFESEQQTVSKSVTSTIPFIVLNSGSVEQISDFDACQNAEDHKEPIVTSNYSSFFKGYAATIPKNPLFSQNLTFFVNNRKACAGYLIDSNREIQSKKKIIPNAVFQCLPVFNSYLASQLNSEQDLFNVTEDLDAKCLNHQELDKLCEHTHEFTTYITLCYSKGLSEEEDLFYQSQSEATYQAALNKSLDIHVYLKNDKCFTKKVTLSQRLGFCRIMDGFLQISLFSYESFKRTVFRKSMINPSDDFTFYVAIIILVGLLVSYTLMNANRYKSNQSGADFHLPLILQE